jgi:hypothetical protein
MDDKGPRTINYEPGDARKQIGGLLRADQASKRQLRCRNPKGESGSYAAAIQKGQSGSFAAAIQKVKAAATQPQSKEVKAAASQPQSKR